MRCRWLFKRWKNPPENEDSTEKAEPRATEDKVPILLSELTDSAVPELLLDLYRIPTRPRSKSHWHGLWDEHLMQPFLVYLLMFSWSSGSDHHHSPHRASSPILYVARDPIKIRSQVIPVLCSETPKTLHSIPRSLACLSGPS